ncbi:RraA family protein [Methylobacterium oryzisoli]|uniref:RraA family protein n=1 Tax=Methylobacterium oryzisoli TaxID=3385502 RepID=UPI003891D51A
MVDTVHPSASPVVPAILAMFRGVATATISDNLERLPGPVGLRAFHQGGDLLGTALTVRVRAGDNLAIHQALNLARPGEVIVVDGGGDTSRALVGDIMKAIAESRGVAGFVIDGAIRDSAAFAASKFPCYARAAIHRGPYKTGPGAINVPVSVGGCVVAPGDIVVGDADGVVTFPPDVAASLIKAVQAQVAREAEVLQMIRDGRYDGRYAKPSR